MLVFVFFQVRSISLNVRKNVSLSTMSQDVLLKEFSSISWNNGTFDMCLRHSYWHLYRSMHLRLLNVTADFPEDPQAVLLMQCVFGHTQIRLNKAISPSLHNVNLDSYYLIFYFLFLFSHYIGGLVLFQLIILHILHCLSIKPIKPLCSVLPLILVIFSTPLSCPVEWMKTT